MLQIGRIMIGLAWFVGIMELILGIIRVDVIQNVAGILLILNMTIVWLVLDYVQVNDKFRKEIIEYLKERM
jgi:hypothetical protein